MVDLCGDGESFCLIHEPYTILRLPRPYTGCRCQIKIKYFVYSHLWLGRFILRVCLILVLCMDGLMNVAFSSICWWFNACQPVGRETAVVMFHAICRVRYPNVFAMHKHVV